MIIQLPFPHEVLWPNGGNKWPQGMVADQKRKHRGWAFMAAKAALGGDKYQPTGERIPIRLIVSAKSRGPLPDKDNCLAAAKSLLDGIADALGVNDNLFDPQPVYFSGRQSNFTIEVG